MGSSGPSILGEGTITGGTAEDRFFGVTNPAGILSITISMANSIDWEVDHLQYGIAVPECATASLLGVGGLMLLGYAGRLKLLRRKDRRDSAD